MKKESFSDKVIKRFYGISGPLDEYKRHQAEKIGNMAFIVLSAILLIGNAIALLFSQKYPEIVALAYPLFLTFVILILFFVIIIKSQSSQLTEIDIEELSPKEKKQLHHVGLKAGLYFGTVMYFFTALMDSDLSFVNSLLHPKTILTGIINAILFGFFTSIFVKLKTNGKDKV